MLARASAAEVLVGHDDGAGLHLGDEACVEVLHAVLGKLRGVGGVQIARRDDDVGVDVTAVAVGGALDAHLRSSPSRSSGSAMCPATAVAAATAGEARYTSEDGSPMRPTKLRLVVATARSPAARIPMCPPRQGPQVGVETAAPASTKMSNRPSCMASRQIRCVAGMTMR